MVTTVWPCSTSYISPSEPLLNSAPIRDLVEGELNNPATRKLLTIGHDVRQVPPVYAKPFRQNKE
jgi:hypothetical protein